ncbi:MAG TPA: polysaccharide biosynthesis/export family protein [Bosea sp. (in: a-proteobacteria)]|jgi:polysaccharide export outer membrane protein|uniref:polysaccharide biosynthesis/export family protein n=1 Tax=Bosea sp. (in: a-proteobacteria) TaxID=1871050 RepID=UPI002E15CF04|nr:polysaccharide biosynthesis/export family protein [Bosea sp. (in: a-proteobacteria)]
MVLAGCSTLPASGPSTSDIVAQPASNQDFGFELVDLSASSLAALNSRATDSFNGSFGDHSGATESRIGIGDFVAVTIWEAGAGGLFSAPLTTDRFSPGSRTATIPEQAVARDGTISVPYAGRVNVAGKTAAQVQTILEERLAGKAIQPQILVTISRPISSTVAVTGEVASGGRIPLSNKGDRILEVIAAAGGIRAPVNETEVRLTRGSRTLAVPMITIVNNPAENIYLRGGDTLTLVRNPRTFIAAGATGINTEIPFNADAMNLAQAVAKAGGLLDFRADPEGVFLYRFESAEVLRRIKPNSPLLGAGRSVPVVYRVNLRDPMGMFVAQGLRMQRGDILYVSNAPLTEVQKAFSVFQSLTSPVVQGASVAAGFK